MAIRLPLHLSAGEYVTVDDRAAAILEPYLRSGFRIVRAGGGLHRPAIYQPQPGGVRRPYIRLARWVMRAQADQFPQHHDGDVLNCQRANLYLHGSGSDSYDRQQHEQSRKELEIVTQGARLRRDD